MDTAALVAFLQESLFLIVTFVAFLMITLSFGRQTITNIILGLYFALLLVLEFPYFDQLLAKTSDPKSESILILGLYLVFAGISAMLFMRILPREYDEKMFEGFWKKFLLALGGTILVTAFSFHALPVTELISPGTPVQFLFGSENSFFWWMMVPIIILFLV